MSEPQPRRDFTVQQEQDGATEIVAVAGEVDLATAGRLEGAMIAAEKGSLGPVLLDLTEVDFIDSTGLRVVLGSIKRLTAERRSLTVCCPAGPVRRLFELTALTGQFELYQSRAEALSAISR